MSFVSIPVLIQKFIALIFAVLSVAYADVSHLYDNSNGYNYPRPTIPFPPPTAAPRCAPGLLGVYPDCYAPTTPTPICPPGKLIYTYID